METKKYRLKYPRSKFWLIFWILIFLPIGLVLLFSNLRIISGHRAFRWEYEGARFWLYFWALLFFPIALLLGLFKGSFVMTTQ